jgi:hypothetical protein
LKNFVWVDVASCQHHHTSYCEQQQVTGCCVFRIQHFFQISSTQDLHAQLWILLYFPVLAMLRTQWVVSDIITATSQQQLEPDAVTLICAGSFKLCTGTIDLNFKVDLCSGGGAQMIVDVPRMLVST